MAIGGATPPRIGRPALRPITVHGLLIDTAGIGYTWGAEAQVGTVALFRNLSDRWYVPMESCLFIAGAHHASDLLQRIGDVLRRVMPSTTRDTSVTVQLLPEVDGGVVTLAPNDPEFHGLVHFWRGERLAVLVYGSVVGEEEPAKVLAEAYARGDIETARQLEGSYSVLFVDLRRGIVDGVSDLIGERTFYWCSRERMLVLSPHIVSLVASGRLELNWDATSIASIACFDWSLGRKPVLENVEPLAPTKLLRWCPEVGPELQPSTPLSLSERISPKDHVAVSKQLDKTVDVLLAATRKYVAQFDQISAGLTAGMDSRAILGLLIGAGAREKVRAYTAGLAESIDVQGAIRLAKMCGVAHRTSSLGEPARGDFIKNTRLLAFLTNGNVNAKRAV
ncbi:MAG: hypothetical protein ACC645_04920 [Pirellulales bacterium]